MREKQIHRLCNKCGVDRRTTVHEFEEANYFCRECLEESGKLSLNESSTSKGFIVVIIVFVLAFVLGILFGKII